MDARGLTPGTIIRPEYEVTPRQLADLLGSQKKPLVLDVRLDSEFRTAQIKDSLHIPLHLLEGRVDEVIDAAAGRMVVTLCHHGVRSLKASLFLRQVGVSGAMSMAGGIDAWSLAIDASVPRYERSGEMCRLIG
ncbi:MAG: sulfurtransferase [Planctomycetes bacterium]|nr:sulfurtransferase [Planctomycetota bacterium]